jgi:hypothetical protein
MVAHIHSFAPLFSKVEFMCNKSKGRTQINVLLMLSSHTNNVLIMQRLSHIPSFALLFSKVEKVELLKKVEQKGGKGELRSLCWRET